MRKIFFAAAGVALGYGVGAVVGWQIIPLVSSNVHDLDLEAAMTGAFVTGPIGALVGLVAGLLLARRA